MEMHGWTTWWGPRPARQAEAWQDFTSLVAWLLGLQLLDLLSTLGALSHGAVEANPLAAALLASSGMAGLVQLKVLAIVLFLGFLPAFKLVHRPGAEGVAAGTGFLAVMALLTVGYSAVVVHNLAVLTAQMGA